MEDREHNIAETKAHVGWAYSELAWPTEESARRASAERDALLSSLSGGRVRFSFRGTKVHLGELSRGCRACGGGTWSCLLFNGLCNARCFFCPQDRTIRGERAPMAQRIVFERPRDYADYLERMGCRGVGISGGEPLLAFGRLLSFIGAIRERFGDSIYLWLYSNGGPLTAARLRDLRAAGIDELRLNVFPGGYDLKPVALARRVLPRVTVEVPAVPEDFRRLAGALAEMERIGVAHLNLHQLHATAASYRNFIPRGYTFLHHTPGYPVPVLESELAALRLLRAALDRGLSLPVNYCSHVFKYRFQQGGFRRQAAAIERRSFEGVTASGYIRRVTARGRAEAIGRLVEFHRGKGAPADLLGLDGTGTELSLHPSLVGRGPRAGCDYLVRYFDARLSDREGREIALNPGKTIFAERRLLEAIRLRPADLPVLIRAMREGGEKSLAETGKRPAGHDARRLLESLRRWEIVPSGLGGIY